MTPTQLIGRVRRTEHYLPEDLELASRVIRSFDRVVTLHSILTEVSNLSGQLPEPHRTNSLTLLAGWIHILNEHQVTGRELAELPSFPRLGLTDTAVLHVAQSGYVVFTDDFPLTGYLESAQLPVLDFNHLREDSWGI